MSTEILPKAKPEIREHMVQNGVRPEDNAASRQMIALRYPGEDPDSL